MQVVYSSAPTAEKRIQKWEENHMENTKAPEGALEVKQEFSKTLTSGTEVKFTILADMANLDHKDLEEALSELAMFSRRFYLHLGIKISNTQL